MKHLVIKYFDYYSVGEYLFDTKEEAMEFVDRKNEEYKDWPHTWFEYRGEVEDEDEKNKN